jgi:hydroxyacylglutathione hydrolase
MLKVTLIPILDDNYTYVIQSGEAVGLVDVGEAAPVIKYLEEHDLTPSVIFTTHHHGDHIDGNQAIKDKYGCQIIAPEKDIPRIPNVDQGVNDNDILIFGDEGVQVIETAGHTSNQINFWFKNSSILFSGDTLFAMGCGRLFEGTAEDMFTSFQKLNDLPDNTTVYCGHEYTISNGEFGLSVEPENQDLINRMVDVKALRERNTPTIPTTMELERKTNVFLRAEDAATFKKYRDLKDNF